MVRHLALISIALSLGFGVGCDGASAPVPDGPAAGGKADGTHGVVERTREGDAILAVANTSDFETLDDAVGLDRRAAEGIVERRGADGFATLAELDAVPHVGPSAFGMLLAFAEANGLIKRRLAIGTFNIRWFGLDGRLFGKFGSETRTDTVRAVIDEHLAEYDVIVFQEIVDTELFAEEVMFDRVCTSYDPVGGKHQSVMLCHTDQYAFESVEKDGDFALEELRFGNLRPGLHGRLVTVEGAPVANIVGVHLKADDMSTERRLDQAEVLAEHVEALRDVSELPVIIIGDFNTHRARDTGLADDDEVLMGELLDEHLARVPLPVANTYRGRDGRGLGLDQAWLSEDIVVHAVSVPGPCNLDFETGKEAIVQYFDDVSDHCPVLFDLEL